MVRFYKTFALFVLILAALTGQAQQAKNAARKPAYRLGWKGMRADAILNGRTVYKLDLADADISGGLPVLVVEFKDKTVSSYSISNAVWRPLSPSEKTLVDTGSIFRETVTVDQAIAAHKPVSIVRIVPFRRNPVSHQLEKLMAFDPVIAYANNAAARSGGDGNPHQPQDGPSLTPYLATGNWYRIGVTQSGVYKLTAADLRRLGMSVSGNKFALVGGQGAPLSERVVNDVPEYLKLWSVQPVGLQDGSFDDADYVLFYAEGVDTWSYNASLRRYQHNNNIYADTAYYFVSMDAAVQSPGVSLAAAPVAPPPTYFTSYTGRHLYEKDLVNIIKAGKQWLAEPFDFTLTRDYTFQTPGRLADSVVRVTMSAAAASPNVGSRFDFLANGQNVGKVNISQIGTGQFDSRAASSSSSARITLPASNTITVTANYVKTITSAVGYMDYIEVECQQALAYSGSPLAFRQAASAGFGTAGYEVSGLNGQTRIWKISDPAAAAVVIADGSGRFADSAGSVPSEFIAFEPGSAATPGLFGKVPAQNLAGMAAPNLIILTHPNFLAQAERLAEFRRTFDGLTATVVTTSQVYNEFSGGKQDLAAIRNFARWLYLQPSSQFRYLTLFGDCSFDYRSHQVSPSTNTAFIPIYERPDSFNPVSTWASDDFFAFLDKTEGGWSGNDKVDIGVGRLAIRTTTEAENVVSKMIRYSSDREGLGAWRNVTAFVADNGDGLIHMDQAESLANIVEEKGPPFLSSKIFLPAYPQVAGPGGLTSPALKAAIRQRLADGALVMNYTGHGSEFQWADEKILDPELINELDNADRLPFFITATCEFGRLDDPSIFSSAENLVVRAGGGGIGVFSACRPVYSFSNYDLNSALYKDFFTRVNGELPRLGDVYRQTKNNNNTQSSNYPFILFGDPSLRLNYPKEQVYITSMTDADNNPIDTVSALSTVKLKGDIRDRNGEAIQGYKGTLQVTFYDKKSEITVVDYESGVTIPGKFRLRKNIIFNGTARIENGQWQITFQVPLDINYTFGQGKLSMYAWPDEGMNDANGYRLDSLVVGGSSGAASESDAPSVRLFMNDTTFQNGGTVGEDATFIARLADKSGINVSQSGIGHEMVALFSHEGDKGRILNDYYVTDPGDATKGTVRFPLKGLKPGSYSVSFKAWDLHNNSATARLEFTVRAGKCPQLDQIKTVPNPMTFRTEFQASLSQPGGLMDVSVDVFDMVGRKVATLAKKFDEAPARLTGAAGMVWHGTYANGVPVANGTYLYRIMAQAEGGCRSQQVGRLVINR